MFIVTYTYKVSKNKVDQYLDIERRAKKVYLKHGCIGYEVFKSDNGWFLEINRFINAEHYENVEKSVGSDPEIEILWKEFCFIVEKEKIATKKYEQVL
ncbi:MAG: hypothetical protein OEY24_08435 [Candidatus Bathyarchaeota archaeon]|nr:hypothetical protein [Candidatus Bathyarchaeota archaeon]